MAKKPTQEKEKTLRWEALEFQYVEKSIDWYWTVGGIALALSTGAALAGIWSLSALIIISTALLIYMARQKPRMITVTINSRYLTVGEKKYSMKEIGAYRFHTDHNKLLFKPISNLKPLVVAPINFEQQTEKLELLLSEKLELEEDDNLEEPWIEVILRQWGF